MSFPRRPLAIALGFVIVIGLLAVITDATTLRIVPKGEFPPATYTAFPGERLRVELVNRWATPVKSSNPAAVIPLGGNWFIAAGLGTSTLSSVIPPPPGEEMLTLLWRATVEVRLPGT